ncbi:hypothetical protein NBRC116598_20300 [Pseudophaeobacter arcticus]|uniref:Uncharacterized protein n=1 Tax=Pseudophaeobacter arcticus TaxID=385492 RepID=A0ABQ0AL36_9RHOB
MSQDHGLVPVGGGRFSLTQQPAPRQEAREEEPPEQKPMRRYTIFMLGISVLATVNGALGQPVPPPA